MDALFYKVKRSVHSINREIMTSNVKNMLIFVLVVVTHLDNIQAEVDQSKDDTTETTTDLSQNLSTQTAPLSKCPLEYKIEARSCVNSQNITIIDIESYEFVGDEIMNITHILSDDSEKCCDFSKINGSFFANVTCIDPSCKYHLYRTENFSTYYTIAGSSIREVETNCPDMNNICINSLKECPLTKLSVKSVLQSRTIQNGIDTFISFNVSWDKNDSINDQVQIKIFPCDTSSKNEYCGFHTELFPFSLSTKKLVIPAEAPPHPEIQPGCTYDIILSSMENHFECNTSYLVPECVEKKCDCNIYKSKPSIISVQHKNKEEFLIKWRLDKSSHNKTFYTVHRPLFEYKKSLEPGYIPFNRAKTISDDTFLSTISMQLFDGENYTLRGTFMNNVSCAEIAEISFTAPFRTSEASIVPTIVIILIVIVSTIIILKYRTIKRYVYKLKGHVITSPPHNDFNLAILNREQIPLNPNICYTPREFLEGAYDQYEFPKNKIILKEWIGSGAFGTVYSAKAIGIGGVEAYRMVAVKTLGNGENVTKEDVNDFIAEIEIFKKIGKHPNIVELLGCCTVETPFMMIMEFVPCGNLKDYLVNLREQWISNKNCGKKKQIFFPPDDSDGAYIEPPTPGTPVSITSSRLPSTSETVVTTVDDPMTPLLAHYTQALKRVLDHNELQNFALQIARGMAHLEKIPITHRDLAARNILINEYKELKISDFGLSRSGPYINHKTKKLPLRWMAVEAIVNQKYDSKSDVWSFGVVLWEIGTLGAFPYDNIPDSFIQQFLQMGRRLERPEICTDELYALMRQCWATDPDQRPTFRELVEDLDVKKRKVYVNFSQLNPTYVFPPSDIKQLENPVRIVPVDFSK